MKRKKEKKKKTFFLVCIHIHTYQKLILQQPANHIAIRIVFPRFLISVCVRAHFTSKCNARCLSPSWFYLNSH